MTKFGESQAIRRVEDLRLLTGRGRFVDDIVPEGALFAYFFRATVAHAEILVLDVRAARRAPGVHLVLTADDLAASGVVLGMQFATVPNRDGSKGAGPERPVLARGRIRHVGEAVAMIVADSLAAAQDAAELIVLHTRDLPVALSVTGGGAAIHPEAPGNLAFDWAIGDDDAVETSLAASAHRVSLDVLHNRVIVNSLEARAAFAEWDGARLHLCVNGQGVWIQKRELARMLGLPPAAVRVTNPDVGGGFGMKAMTYPEYVVIAQAARLLGHPVRWASDRTEAMLSDNAGRDLVARAELGFDAAHRITATGHAHLDTAWLWPIRETRRKVVRTFANALSLLKSNPDYVFCHSQAQHYAWVAEDAHEVFDEVKRFVALGRLEIEGGLWV
jgi:carbon-monoxide dehydrogenase large subunit